MAVILVGEIVNSCDGIGGFTQGNISTDDDFVEGTGAIGLKASVSTNEEIYTSTLGAGAPYDFSSGGTENGWHFISWFNTKTPIDATSGLRLVMGDGTDRGNWYVTPSTFYKGGFITRVVDTARQFDAATAGYNFTDNPEQLSSIARVGGAFFTTTSIMGNFNNVQLDQFTIGLGLRVSGGTTGTTNTFEEVRADDEDTNFYGWWSSSNGAVVGKGKLFIGPETGNGTTVFDDSAFTVIFADELVNENFYEINTRGGGTDVTWELGSISSADSDLVRWRLTVDPTTNSFNDTNSVLVGASTLSLQPSVEFNGTTLIDCSKIIQSGATLDGITVLDANTSGGTVDNGSFIISNNPTNIKNSTFDFSDGHAIEIITGGTFTFDNNTFNGYGVSGSTDAAIYNNSGSLVTLNLQNVAAVPTIRNSSGSTTVAEITTTVKITVLDASDSSVIEGARVLLLADSGGDLPVDTEILDGNTNASGIIQDTGFNFTSPQPVTGRVRKGTTSPLYKQSPITGTITSSGLDISIFLVTDE